MGFRRVVTGYSSNGSSVVLSDESVSSVNLGAGSLIDLMWALNGEPRVPNEGSIGDIKQWFPDVGGIRVFTWVKQPAAAPDPAAPDGEVLDVGLSNHYEAENPGMHVSQSIDVNVVLSGELWLELDDGASVHLHPGDVLVQNGTRHKWENRTEAPTTVLSVVVGAARES